MTISYSIDAPRLELAADADVDGEFETMMGDAAPDLTGAELSMKLSVAAPDNETLRAAAAQELNPEELKALIAGKSRFKNKINKNTGTKKSSRYLACVYKNGRLYKAWRMDGAGSVEFNAPAREGDYFRAELLGLPPCPCPCGCSTAI